jgi:hypothetical protein
VSGGELILYTAEDGSAVIQLRAEGGSVWLTQLEMATLFDTSKQNISLHIKNILAEGELSAAVVKEYLTTASDGKSYKTKAYSLDMILAVGYRVRSPRGTQFRQWATIFSDSGLQPQSYLDRLRRFTEIKYARSEVAQSHPTVVLELNHIRFELVPAVRNWFSDLQIPGKGSGYQSWQDTDPNGFNQTLSSANQANGNLIKPLIRAMKYWNATAKYPFESYALEQHIAGQGYGFFGLLASRQLADYFIQAANSLMADWSAPQWKQDAVSRLKQLASLAQSQERSGNSIQAEATINRLLPPVGGMLGI